MQYKIFTEEINRVHGEYLITADSEEVLKKFDLEIFDDTPEADVWGNEITEIEIYENED